MSVPIRSEDGIDNPLSYAPRRARHSRSVAPEHFAAPLTTSTYGAAPRIAKATPMAPGIGGHNIDLPRSMSRPFEGDVAIKDLRRRLSLDPQLDPEPPMGMRLQSRPQMTASALESRLCVVVPRWFLIKFVEEALG